MMEVPAKLSDHYGVKIDISYTTTPVWGFSL